MTTRKHEIVIIGGGCAGISVAARLCKAIAKPDIAIIEPSADHYYQPLWTLVGGGDAKKESTVRREESLIPDGAHWIQDRVIELKPDEKKVVTDAGAVVGYEILVVAPGIQLNWDRIEGLHGNVGRDGICSNYSYETVDSTWRFIREFNGGTAVFTHPDTPIKCGGAPQKIMYLAAENFEKRGLADRTDILFGIASPSIFAVERYARTLLEVVERHGIDVRYRHDLKAVRPDAHEAVFRHCDTGAETVVHYDLLHVTPPMSAPDFVRRSPLADAAGWVDVDKHTLRHVRYPEVFSLGDASNLPTSKTGAAIRKQAPVTARNVLAVREGREPEARYDGYTSCPLVTGYGRLVLAEFDYDGKAQETFPVDQSKERRSMYFLKKHVLPRLYWSGMLKGRA